jgi:hypothetical protein
MPDPVLDASTPCCLDSSRWPKTLKDQCAFASKILAGATGGMGSPATGTFSNSLNATNGTEGGGGGSSWSLPDEPIAESWL